MPEQAFALKKYRCGTSPVSKTSDNEHTSAALGHSEELSVKNAVGEPITAAQLAVSNALADYLSTPAMSAPEPASGAVAS